MAEGARAHFEKCLHATNAQKPRASVPAHLVRPSPSRSERERESPCTTNTTHTHTHSRILAFTGNQPRRYQRMMLHTQQLQHKKRARPSITASAASQNYRPVPRVGRTSHPNQMRASAEYAAQPRTPSGQTHNSSPVFIVSIIGVFARVERFYICKPHAHKSFGVSDSRVRALDSNGAHTIVESLCVRRACGVRWCLGWTNRRIVA